MLLFGFRKSGNLQKRDRNVSENKGESKMMQTASTPVGIAPYLVAASMFSTEAVKDRQKEQAAQEAEAQRISGRHSSLNDE
jgi:hypothetical protein